MENYRVTPMANRLEKWTNPESFSEPSRCSKIFTSSPICVTHLARPFTRCKCCAVMTIPQCCRSTCLASARGQSMEHSPVKAGLGKARIGSRHMATVRVQPVAGEFCARPRWECYDYLSKPAFSPTMLILVHCSSSNDSHYRPRS